MNPTTDTTDDDLGTAPPPEAGTSEAPNAATGAPTAPAPKRGRGPTSPAVKFAKLVEDTADHPHRDAFLTALQSNRPAKDVRASAKATRLALKLHTETKEAEIEILDETSAFLDRVEELPESLRRALIATLEPDAPKP